MLTSGTAPPSGTKLSWAQFTAPADVPVVLAAKRPQDAAPKRTSLPSMLPPAGDRLRGPFHGGHRLRGMEVLDDALAHEEQGPEDGEGEQDAGAGPGEVHPEVAQRAGASPDQPADERHRDRRSRSRRDEVVE